jgi:signal transduction histidine kinase
MLRVKLLRNLMMLALAIAVLLPWYEYLFVHPAYQELLIEETESEAVRYAGYMVRTLGLENESLTKDRLPEGLTESLWPVKSDQHLLKLNIFSAQGEIIFSTLPEEVGSLNKNRYFREIVAKGQVYSKVVHKDRKTAEGTVATIDIVETYVPFMTGDLFGGAVEVYYDVTEGVGKIKYLTLHSIATTLVMSLGFLLAITAALYRAFISFQERDIAEESLRVVNEELEQRVTERTQELSEANEQLTAQIAERIHAQIALRQALEEIKADRGKLNGILHSVPDGVVVADDGLKVLHMNAAAEELLQISLAGVMGQSIAMLSSEVDFVEKVGQCLINNHSSLSFDFELSDKKIQKTHVYQVRISQLVSDEAGAFGVVLLIRDVTRERDVEQMKSAFLGMAAHELNTPLTTIMGYSELLTAEETADVFDAEQQKEYLLLIHNKALALGGLIDDLLDISRVESGRPLVLNYQEFDLGAMISEVVLDRREAHNHHVFEITLPNEAARLCADRLRLGQVLNHLLSNAVKYSPGDGSIRVSLITHDKQYELTVEDDGIGMNEEQLAHIFDRFYRADSSNTAVQGVGLGMSIVHHIVLAHHGDIQIDSQPGSGTRVCITLPMTLPVGTIGCRQPFSS